MIKKQKNIAQEHHIILLLTLIACTFAIICFNSLLYHISPESKIRVKNDFELQNMDKLYFSAIV